MKVNNKGAGATTMEVTLVSLLLTLNSYLSTSNIKKLENKSTWSTSMDVFKEKEKQLRKAA